MLLADAEKLTLKLMGEFGLIAAGFTFEFDEAEKRFGCCHRTITRRYKGDGQFETVHTPGGRITLSRKLTMLNDVEKVEDVIRHEIAHALCGPKEGHGSEWKRMCKKTGAKPERCYDEEVEVGDSPYTATCAVCGTEYHRHKLPRGDRWCSNKECKHKLLPYIPGQESGSFHPMRKLIWRHRSQPVPKAEDKRAALEAMKKILKGEQ